ncbi:hypothetical protein TNCV_3583761 [Trichonephila clavipes]|nr:hypothetical protein TNCV_3583761 [Trichonephila clavipes]
MILRQQYRKSKLGSRLNNPAEQTNVQQRELNHGNPLKVPPRDKATFPWKILLLFCFLHGTKKFNENRKYVRVLRCKDGRKEIRLTYHMRFLPNLNI